MVSKQEIIGKEIMERIHIHDVDTGGVFTVATGSQGSAKTSILLAFAEYALAYHPDEKIFWSESYKAPLQITKLEPKKYRFYCKHGLDFIFRDRDKKRKPIKMPFVSFKDYDDLYEKAKLGKINVAFFGNRMYWMDFIEHVAGLGEWVHIFIDEISEVCPAYQPGNVWKRIGDFSDSTVKDVRKDFINMHTNTQRITKMDHRLRDQIMIKIFLPGAIVDKKTRITQPAVDNLIKNKEMGNQAYLDYDGGFGVTVFRDIYKPRKGCHWDVICNGGRGIPYTIPSFDDEK